MTTATLSREVTAPVEADTEEQSLVELTSLELALVGGGAANVCFL